MEPTRRSEEPVLVIDLDDGETLQAANEAELAGVVAAHLRDNPDQPQLNEDEIRDLVSSRAYEAMDS
jgi:hypothetical protein